MKNSFGSRSVLRVGNREFEIYRLDSLEKQGLKMARLPYSLRILLENLLRREDGESVTAEMIRSLAAYSTSQIPTEEIAFMPSRVLLQDLTGVPAIVDLAAMRDAMKALGGDAGRINPLQPVELVIDHSVQVDEFGTPEAFKLNAEMEYSRNRARYAFLRWGQKAFENLAIVPPDTGICHQINLEFLARVVFAGKGDGGRQVAYPDTVVGADSHTTMINSLGVLGWGVGGIEAEAAMLGQPISMLIPQVVGVRLSGQLPEGSTATDLVLTITQMLRKKGVVGKFVEYFGPGLPNLPLADRAVIANMSPEYGSTCGIFPVDEETLRYLRLSGRSDDQVKLVESYCKEQGLFHTATTPEAEYSDVVSLDLATVEPSIAGPKRPQDRIPLSRAAVAFREALPALVKPGTVIPAASEKSADGQRTLLKKGRDPRKDQSYFLFSLRQHQLARALFPLGEKSKQETRQAARERQLKTAEKEESMEICFVPDNDYGKFLSAAKLAQPHEGEVVDLQGRVLGRHEGVEYFTIGQRKGLRISAPKPLYVIELDAARNRVVVGDDAALDRDAFNVERCNWIPFDAPPAEMAVTAKIRYNHPGTPATIRATGDGTATVKLHVPQRAITPGQACVFYDADLVLGGGWITAQP